MLSSLKSVISNTHMSSLIMAYMVLCKNTCHCPTNIHRQKTFTLTFKCLVIRAIPNDTNDHPTCFMEVVFSQLKQPQVHVGDGIEGPTGQQYHFSLPVRLFHCHSSQPQSQVENVGVRCQPLQEMGLKRVIVTYLCCQ